MAFIMKAWRVHVSGFSSVRYFAASRGKALSAAWSDYSSFNAVSFGEFLKIAKVFRIDSYDGFGDLIEVGGQPAHYLTSDSQYVHICRPDSDVVLFAHPLDVYPDRYRPTAYRGLEAA